VTARAALSYLHSRASKAASDPRRDWRAGPWRFRDFGDLLTIIAFDFDWSCSKQSFGCTRWWHQFLAFSLVGLQVSDRDFEQTDCERIRDFKRQTPVTRDGYLTFIEWRTCHLEVLPQIDA
jgi:hypothetical protein